MKRGLPQRRAAASSSSADVYVCSDDILCGIVLMCSSLLGLGDSVLLAVQLSCVCRVRLVKRRHSWYSAWEMTDVKIYPHTDTDVFFAACHFSDTYTSILTTLTPPLLFLCFHQVHFIQHNECQDAN
jgi:hypothetical protein